MSSYTEIDTALLDLDFTNPRIQNYLQNYPEESRSGEKRDCSYLRSTKRTCYAARNWN